MRPTPPFLRPLSSRPLRLALVLAVALPLASCGDEPAGDGGDQPRAVESGGQVPGAETGTDTAAGDGSAPTPAADATKGRTHVETPTRPEPAPLPDAPALTDEVAVSVLHSGLADLAPEDTSRATLLYLAELGDRAAVDAARRELLEREDGAYVDDEAAALGLEVLLAFGEPDAAGATLDLARSQVEGEVAGPAIAHALSRIDGPQRAEAERLLAAIAGGDDDEAALIALETLASRRSSAATLTMPTVARDAERLDALRGSAVAALLVSGDATASSTAEAVLESDIDASDVIAGFGIEGAVETVPYIQRMMKSAMEEGNADFEFASACYALATIYQGSPDAAHARDLITGWLREDPSLDGDEATYALWLLGDAGRTQAAAEVLARQIGSAARHDAELSVDLLDEVARRGLGRDPLFAKAVNAAAVAPERTDLPGLDLDTQWLRAAAAHAYLKSR